MRLQSWALLCLVVLSCSGFLSAQTEPNLENGFKPHGSYHGSDVDTVSIMNGNVTVHIPFPAEYPQRGGSLHDTMIMVGAAKGWKLISIPNSTEMAWAPSRAFMGASDNLHPAHIRTLLQTTASGQTIQSVTNNALVTWDGSTHPLMDVSSGKQIAFESTDASGWHISMSSPNQYGIPQNAIITDRAGTQYTVSGYRAYQTCGGGAVPLFSSEGGHPPLQTPNGGLPLTISQCEMVGVMPMVADANGNTFSILTSGIDVTDTMGRHTASVPPTLYVDGFGTASTPNSNPPGCVGAYSFYGSGTISYPGVNGNLETILVCYANFTIQTAFGLPNDAEFPNATAGGDNTPAVFISSIVLPDGSSWVFNYDSYANFTYIGLPLGGSISYQWATVAFPSFSGFSPASRTVTQRTITDNNGHTHVWKYHWLSSQNNPLSVGGTFTNVITDPLGNDTVHVFTHFQADLNFYETTTRTYQGPYTGGALLKEVDTGYQGTTVGDSADGIHGAVLPISIQTTVYPSGKVNLIQTSYDAALTDPTSGTASYGKVVTEQEYDWDTGKHGPLLRETDTTYKWQVDSDYLTAHFLDLPASVVVKDGSGCALSETDYTYDESAYLTPSNIIAQHTSPPLGVRGNLTTTTRWLASAATCNPKGGTPIVSHTNWYDTGEVYQQIDPLGKTTTHTYDPAYVGAFPTQTCNPAGQCVSGTYDFTTGLLTSFTNMNATAQAGGNTPGDSAHTTFYAYDLMSRMTSATFPPDPANGGAQAQTTFRYPTPITLPFTVTRSESIAPGLTDSFTTTFDGLGRVYKTQHPLPNGVAEVDTTYDGLDHVVSVTNPYFSTGDATYGTVQSQYDALGRVMQVTDQDGSVKKMAYNLAPIQAAPGDCTQSTDEAGKQRMGCRDGLGRLIEVHEPGDNFNGSQATGIITVSGTLQSQPDVGAVGASYATAQVILSGTDHATVTAGHQQCLPPPGSCFFVPGFTTYDAGAIVLLVNGTRYSASFTTSTNASAYSLALTIFNQMTNDPNVTTSFTSTPDGKTATISLQARNPGVNGNSIAISSTYTSQFSPPSFITTPTTGNLAGGTDAVPGSLVYDKGNVSATVSGFTATVNYGQSSNSTAAQVAAALATALSVPGSPVTASSSGAQLTVTYNNVGTGGNTSVSVASQSTQTQWTFPPNAFTGSGSLSPAYNPEGASLDFNYFVTQYAYDGLGNLLTVTQMGDPAVNTSSQWRVRNFTYDSLGRLLTAQNPESGLITYAYDNDANLLQKTAPAPNQTGTATQTVSYCYDTLNRVTGKGYGAQSCPLATPVVSYVYDNDTNAIGKLTSLTDQAGTASYTYDILGRLAAETRPIAGVSKSTSYTYNLDGSVKTLTYPSGRIVTYTPGAAGQLVSAVDGNGTNYVTSASYNPDSSLKSLVNGSTPALSQNFQYTPRLQLCRITALTSGTLPTSCTDSQNIGNVMDRGYDFHAGNGTAGSGTDNGNVFGITNYRDTSRSQAFTYDALNRLISGWSSANTGAYSWGENYSIDAWGNLQISPMGGKAHGGTFQLSGNAQNRPTGLAYDAAGNLMSYRSSTYTYDQENRLSSTAGMSYTYDGKGQRALKSNTGTGASVKLYWTMGGNTLAEGDGSGNLTAEYIYFGGKRIARIDLPINTVHYYLSDHLGSTSIVANATGTVEEESDYYPFGTEVNVTGPGVNELKFTGKRRDAESQMDYFGARYYSGSFGRFINADPIFFEADRAFEPQKLNLYAYASANPLRFVDPTGNSPLDAALLARVNNLRQTANQVAVAEIAAYRSGKSGSDNYSARGTYLLHEAASAQQNLEAHGDLQGLFDPQGQYDNALAELSGYLEPQVQQSVLGELSNWANDPNTSVSELREAMLNIAVADGLELPDPNAGNRRLKELTKGLFEKLADEASDRFFDGASIVKKLVSSAVQFADVNHQMRQAGLAGLGGAQNTKDKGKPSNGQKCRESTDGEKSWGPCEY
jgi:RHS repeat-associated protein